MTEHETQKIVQALAERLALALQGTAARFRGCDPHTPNVLESVGEYLLKPGAAADRIEQEVESLPHPMTGRNPEGSADVVLGLPCSG